MKLLSQICTFAKSKTEVANLNNATYISTENMMPDKNGITLAATLPNAEYTQSFDKNDVLVSNIRPYFKKIWRATFDGGCSNDVLVFRATTNNDPTFLYYVLADDNFFGYATQTSKGTKMPRGDKTAIMQYKVPDYDISTQRKMAAVLKSLDDKIELNNKINENLEQQAQAIFKSWFVDFEPFGGKMPEAWEVGTLSNLATVNSGKRPELRLPVKDNGINIPIVGAASIMGYTNKSLYNEKILVTGRVGTHGVIQRFCTPCWTSDNTLVLSTKYYEYVYQILKNIDYKSLNRGSTQPLITQTDLCNVKIMIPNRDILNNFEAIVGKTMDYANNIIQENCVLAELRDSLLPKLMSGEIDVSNVKI